MYGPADQQESKPSAPRSTPESRSSTRATYGMGHNELLIGEAVKGVRREQVVVSVKRCAIQQADGWASTRGLLQSRTSSPTRFSGSASTTSISTDRRGSTPTYRSRRRLAPSARW
jgi:hypothetical protein